MNVNKYPFELKQNFFSSVKFDREKHVSQPLSLQIEIQVNLSEPEFPVVQIGLIAKTGNGSPVSFELEMYGVFEYQGDKKEYDHDLNVEFMFERGLYMLWPNVTQLVKVISSNMGMAPIQIRNPIVFGSADQLQEVAS